MDSKGTKRQRPASYGAGSRDDNPRRGRRAHKRTKTVHDHSLPGNGLPVSNGTQLRTAASKEKRPLSPHSEKLAVPSQDSHKRNESKTEQGIASSDNHASSGNSSQLREQPVTTLVPPLKESEKLPRNHPNVPAGLASRVTRSMRSLKHAGSSLPGKLAGANDSTSRHATKADGLHQTQHDGEAQQGSELTSPGLEYQISDTESSEEEVEISHLSEHQLRANNQVYLRAHCTSHSLVKPLWLREVKLHRDAKDLVIDYWARVGGRTKTVYGQGPPTFEVFAIRGHDWVDGKLHLDIEWVGYTTHTMEPVETMTEDQPELVAEYWKTVRGGRPSAPTTAKPAKQRRSDARKYIRS